MENTKNPTARKTAKERREEAARLREEEKAEFLKNIDIEWLKLWAKALELALLVRDKPSVVEEYQWFFETFEVRNSLTEQYVRINGYDCTKDTLTLNTAVMVMGGLDKGIDCYRRVVEEEERARKEAIEKAERRKTGLAKLTPEERDALGLGN